MSGHSKWSTIKRKKGAEDAKRGKIFTRVARDIAQAAREGGGDENSNAKLKLAIAKAKSANMPKDNIERAVLRGLGKLEGIELEEITYEAYGPDGIAFMVEVLTDNKNRSLAEIKRVLNRAGGSLASAGSVGWQFEQKGNISLNANGVDFDEVFMIAAEAGADDVQQDEESITVFTPRELLSIVEIALKDANYEILDAELKWEPKNETEISTDKALVNMKLMNDLDELDDVQSVASNLLMTDAVIEAFENA